MDKREMNATLKLKRYTTDKCLNVISANVLFSQEMSVPAVEFCRVVLMSPRDITVISLGYVC